ncbi:hypothetical protein SteCoe_3254 [Stentor coeruleus]|uniref:FYVE-type domain-containing protein n=1 Tax=Stentor coeruleus TaxID=5963 RepID=A0A1R2CXI5_9CILI|nr:hypothetical protein SteCoe_3254 [Stentor coeruleus]
MYKLDPDSKIFTSKIQSHNFVNTFKIQESNLGEITTDLRLHQKILYIYLEGKIVQEIIIDQNFAIKSENISIYEINISYIQNEEINNLKIFTNTLDEFLEWKQALQVSRRPVLQSLGNCKICSVRFHLFRKRYYCKACGNAMCSNCCMYRAHLSEFGYRKKQDFCIECVKILRLPGKVAHGSLFFHRPAIENKSFF